MSPPQRPSPFSRSAARGSRPANAPRQSCRIPLVGARRTQFTPRRMRCVPTSPRLPDIPFPTAPSRFGFPPACLNANLPANSQSSGATQLPGTCPCDAPQHQHRSSTGDHAGMRYRKELRDRHRSAIRETPVSSRRWKDQPADFAMVSDIGTGVPLPCQANASGGMNTPGVRGPHTEFCFRTVPDRQLPSPFGFPQPPGRQCVGRSGNRASSQLGRLRRTRAGSVRDQDAIRVSRSQGTRGGLTDRIPE